MLTRHPTSEDFPPAEQPRIRRICDLLAKAIVLDAACQAVSARTKGIRGGGEGNEANRVGASDDARIEGYLRFVGAASPAAMREALGMSRMRVYRAVHRMLGLGKVVPFGRTRTQAYRLATGPTSIFGRN